MSTPTILPPGAAPDAASLWHPSGLPYGAWQLLLGQPDLPNHLQLPWEDGIPVENAAQASQNAILTESLWPVLLQQHPDGRFFVGQDVGIYWRIDLNQPLNGCRAPDWYYVPDVPNMLEGEPRRSYVLWQEGVPPLIVMEFVSRDGREERDRTPLTGKFWIYERVIQARYYVIFEPFTGRLEVYELIGGQYQQMEPNSASRYRMEPLNVELGVWRGRRGNFTELPWLRWWDAIGKLLPTDEERAEQERQRAEQAQAAAEQERQRAERLAERLRALGIDPHQL